MPIEYVEPAGDHLNVVHTDGAVVTCYRMPNGWWQPGVEDEPTPPDPSGKFAWPFPLNQVTTEWEGYPGHKGMDFGIGPSNTEGTAIPASNSGTVEYAGWYSGNNWENWGNMVVINHGNIGVNGETLRTLYAHMYQQPAVSVGQTVSKGQTLGGVGNTGLSFGVHLHFETSIDGIGNQVNPRDFMAVYGE